MTATPAVKLYTPDMLALAVKLAEFPLRPDFSLIGSARSRSCGSTIELGLDIGPFGTISDVGMLVAACAIGQAAAAVFAQEAKGRDQKDVNQALQSLEHWLNGVPEQPDWPGIAILGLARSHPGRHGAILLPWRAASAALCKRAAAG